jgi:hypothetical protein
LHLIKHKTPLLASNLDEFFLSSTNRQINKLCLGQQFFELIIILQVKCVTRRKITLVSGYCLHEWESHLKLILAGKVRANLRDCRFQHYHKSFKEKSKIGIPSRTEVYIPSTAQLCVNKAISTLTVSSEQISLLLFLSLLLQPPALFSTGRVRGADNLIATPPVNEWNQQEL